MQNVLYYADIAYFCGVVFLINKLKKMKHHLPRILVVDDSKVNLNLLSILLEEYEVITINNGDSAINIASAEHIDLILLDIVMPEMDGYEVCTKLKSIEKTKDIPVIFITANTDEESIDRAYKVGGIDYVTKPFKSKELLARVKTQLSFYFLQKELEEKMNLVDKYVSYSSTDTAGVITEASEAFCKLSGYTKEELIGQKHSILRHPDMDSNIYKELWKCLKAGKNWSGEVKNKAKDGTSYWSNVIISLRYNILGDLLGYTAIRHDITNEKAVKVLSITDQLTDLFNRRHFNSSFPTEIKRAIRQSDCLSLLMLDIDFFKQYNDEYGHQEGDKVLALIGETLKHSHRSEDMIFRLGGEEFAVLFRVKSIEDAEFVATGILKSITNLKIEHKMSNLNEKVLSASIGLVSVDFSKKPNFDLTTDKFYKLADDELYKAKSKGRNRVSMLFL